MQICPACGYENLDGTSICENCNSDIVEEKGPITEFQVEKAILEDSLEKFSKEVLPALQVPPDMLVKDVVRQMIDQRKCSVVIVNSEGDIEGIFTERSLILRVCNIIPPNIDKPIKEAMLSQPVILKKTDTVAQAIHHLAAGGYTYAIIDDDPIRVLNIRDILKYFVTIMDMDKLNTTQFR